jgi:hypothetical protein
VLVVEAQRRGWLHRTGCDGEDVLHWPYVTTSSWAGVELVDVPPSRVPSSSFEGRDVEEVREWAAQCHGMTPAFPHSTGDGCIVRVGRKASGSDSQVVSEDRRGGDSPLTRAHAMHQSI